MYLRSFSIASIGALICAFAAPAQAQDAKAEDKKPPAMTQAAPGIKREILQKFDVPGTNYETVIMRVAFDANMEIPRHVHPGPEGSYVLEGDVTYMIDGQEPAQRSAGGSITLPGNAFMPPRSAPRASCCWGATSWRRASRS